MEEYEEYAINDNALELDVIRDFLYQDNHEGEDMMNFESTEHENLIAHDCNHLINDENKIFLNWDYAMKEIEKYGSKQGFKIRCYHVERSNNIIRRRTLVCEHFGQPEATKSKDKKKETTSKRIGCIWQINLSCPKKNNSHKESLEFTVDMINDIEFFVTKMNCSPQQIHKALEKKHSVKIYMPVLYQAFVLKLFTMGMSSTFQIESYNLKIKRLIFNSNTILLELADKLSLCILEEDKKTEYTLFRALIPKAVLVATANTILPNVCDMLHKYLIVEMLKI
ncbi:9681_t:CDS:2 [Gigaspora margarita]|uniref:9681_t:CDS:1 n=1 Tax=Gigaspora margarita TaxID=4874 RepID=A0ABN7VJG0_GIGMA|nr:9681_t:CDS:2 [Gigaspora margarita]